MVIPPAVGSVAAMQESSLPGNLGSRRSYGQGYQDGMKQKRMKMAMTPSFAKVTGEVGFEGSLEEQDGGEYMEIEVKMEKDPGDCPEDLTTPDLKTVFLRNRDYSQLCNERLDGNLVVDRVVKREPDVTSCADTQHVLHVDGGQQIDDARCPLNLSLKEPKYRTVPSSEKQGSRDLSSSPPMQIPIPSNAEAFNKVEKNVNLKSSKELQDDDKDTAGNEGHGVQMSSDVGQTRVGEDGGIDYNGFEEESEEERLLNFPRRKNMNLQQQKPRAQGSSEDGVEQPVCNSRMGDAVRVSEKLPKSFKCRSGISTNEAFLMQNYSKLLIARYSFSKAASFKRGSILRPNSSDFSTSYNFFASDSNEQTECAELIPVDFGFFQP
nr:uncharacterized protein LOC129271788 [Lytechinus pictus]